MDNIKTIDDLVGRECLDRDGWKGRILKVWTGPKGGLRVAYVGYTLKGCKVFSAPASSLTILPLPRPNTSLDDREMTLAAFRPGTIHAIKAYRERTGACLLDAKNAVVAYQISQGIRAQGEYQYP